MEISKISRLWSNIKKYKILTTFHLQYFFKKGYVFSEHVQTLAYIFDKISRHSQVVLITTEIFINLNKN